MSTLSHRLTSILLLPFLIVLAACGNDVEPDAAAPDPTERVEEVAAQPETAARININTATEEELLGIPGVGDRMVHEFEEYRPYVSLQQFRREIGKYVDEEQVAAYEQYLFVPVDPNASDAATLRQLPGLDPTEAQALIAGRPYTTRAAFMEALATYVSEEDLASATAYLINHSSEN